MQGLFHLRVNEQIGGTHPLKIVSAVEVRIRFREECSIFAKDIEWFLLAFICMTTKRRRITKHASSANGLEGGDSGQDCKLSAVTINETSIETR